ncbi:MurR/RpiR family transcriptional regulator [Bengtsoniella intestinalis]|uniref:MurR/RpiR family transcriptional regulator n=1 Tax=Bengtsoniella intestinalis TaxID=3073143 RepID=UPI00391F035D
MSHTNVFEKIDQEYYQLTAAERKVGDYIRYQRTRTQYMSISELAEECGVADATISRFCRRLGYKGYNAFKLAIANSTGKTTEQTATTGDITPQDSVEELCQKLYTANVEAMRQTLEVIAPEAIAQAVEMLHQAKFVYCMGQGGSMILAQEAAHALSTAKQGFVPVWDSHIQAMTAAQMTPDDVGLIFSYSGATKDLEDILTLIHSCGATSVLITAFPKSPGAALADVVLRCGAKEGPLQVGSIGARIAQLFLVDVLFQELIRRRGEIYDERRDVIANAVADKHL